jgi:hypothetical protein
VSATRFLVRTTRAVKLLAFDSRIPKWLRGVVAVGLLPIPGPFDEAVLILVAPILFVFYRVQLSEAWECADARPYNSSGSQPSR